MPVSLTKCALLFDRHFVRYLVSERRAAIVLGRAEKVLGGLEAGRFVPGNSCLLLYWHKSGHQSGNHVVPIDCFISSWFIVLKTFFKANTEN